MRRRALTLAAALSGALALAPAARAFSPFSRMQFPSTSASISVARKQRYASAGVQTIGSPRTLKLVFTRMGQPVRW